jgi:predicted esterase
MACARAWLLIAAALLAGTAADAKVLDKSINIAGMAVSYKAVLPKDYDPQTAYPAVLAFPPGPQTLDMVFTTLNRNWAPEAQRRGYLVFIPAAPSGRLFFEEGSRVFPEFLDKLLAEYKIRDNKFHIAGMSNGGLSAFYIAASHPQYFLSVIGFPGYLPDATPARINALSKMCLYMHVGELDSGWREAMQEQAALFRSKGFRVTLTVEKGQSHVIGTLAGDGATRLFEELGQAAQGCGK